jgi:hypothetical protein
MRSATNEVASICNEVFETNPLTCGRPLISFELPRLREHAPEIDQRIVLGDRRSPLDVEYLPDGKPPTVAITFDEGFTDLTGDDRPFELLVPGEFVTAVEVFPPGTELPPEKVVHEYGTVTTCETDCDMTEEEARALADDLDALEKELASTVPGQLAVGTVGGDDVFPRPETFDLSVGAWSLLPLSDEQQQQVIETVDGRATSVQFATYVAING